MLRRRSAGLENVPVKVLQEPTLIQTSDDIARRERLHIE
jgi:hypothetical protein